MHRHKRHMGFFSCLFSSCANKIIILLNNTLQKTLFKAFHAATTNIKTFQIRASIYWMYCVEGEVYVLGCIGSFLYLKIKKIEIKPSNILNIYLNSFLMHAKRQTNHANAATNHSPAPVETYVECTRTSSNIKKIFFL